MRVRVSPVAPISIVMLESNPHVKELQDISIMLGKEIYLLSNEVFADYRFGFWSASLDNKHHYGKGGLAEHTLEVVKVALNTNKLLKCNVSENELFLACLFHDSGKIEDYSPLDTNYKNWEGTLHKRMIHHITRSALKWNNAVMKYPECFDLYHENVLHAILSHHGLREWGSPVAPYTKVAWLLHLSDSMSARMNDCEKFDVLNR